MQARPCGHLSMRQRNGSNVEVCQTVHSAHHPGRPVSPKFDGKLWAQGESRVQLNTQDPLPYYDRLRFWMTRLLAPLHNMSETDFLKKFGMKSFRSGGATASGTTNIPSRSGASMVAGNLGNLR